MGNLDLAPPAAVQPEDAALEQLVAIDLRVNGAEHDGIMARWEFGRALLAEREANGGKQLPHGRLDAVCAATGKSEREIRYRIQFAEKFTTAEEVGTAVQTFGSWTAIRDEALPEESHNHRAQGTGENEWYTPPQFIAMAREVMDGIDLDPASSDRAQEIVLADRYFTKDDDGLSREWEGRVWLNPPYAQPAIAHFVEKMVAEVSAGRATEAVMLTHNYTDTEWFHRAASIAASICFTRGRIAFLSASGETASPTQGQAFFYYGSQVERFGDVFSRVGFVR